MLNRLQLFFGNELRRLAYNSLVKMETEDGINASGKEEIYGCLFGRDSFITILEILKAHKKSPDKRLLSIARKTLLTHVRLQAKDFNIETGAQPGKFIHEYRKERFEHLTASRQYKDEMPWENPWMLDADNTLKIYDSIDSTPLALIAIYKYYFTTKDREFLTDVLPSVEKGLNWIISYGDLDKDQLIEYEFSPQRKHGGLLVQSWTDSLESMRQPDGTMPKYPIAPVEAQGYAWLALKLWGNFYLKHSPAFGQKLLSQADLTKQMFNKLFIIKDSGLNFAVQALDGYKSPIKTITGNPLLLLYSSFKKNGKIECIVEDKYIPDFIKRAFMEDMFDPEAGIRTMSAKSATFNPSDDSYHNGSFWPILNGMVFSGLLKWGYKIEAKKLKEASIKPIKYFNSPIELYIKTREGLYIEWKNKQTGQTACREQAWSAATILAMSTNPWITDPILKPIQNFLDQFIFEPIHQKKVKKIIESHSTINL